jgi:hypothetical protein
MESKSALNISPASAVAESIANLWFYFLIKVEKHIICNYVTLIFGKAQTIQSILNQIIMNSDQILNFLAW